MRMRVCSLASCGSAAWIGAGVFWEVTIPKFTVDFGPVGSGQVPGRFGRGGTRGSHGPRAGDGVRE
ncbi:hypothetical protein NicSoilB8_02740 [Arthrobacter sp. NicSoilB8]|nr:hypothetical protein NicSoilB8_02740 [Arthrobacter sp. NicSoilB8]